MGSFNDKKRQDRDYLTKKRESDALAKSTKFYKILCVIKDYLALSIYIYIKKYIIFSFKQVFLTHF